MTKFQSNINEQIFKYNSLNALTQEFLSKFEYHVSEQQRKMKFFENFKESNILNDDLGELERAMQVLSDIVYFFKRKKSFYDNYKKLNLKNKEQLNQNSNITLTNQKEILKKIEEEIKIYNKNLQSFLETNSAIQKTLNTCVKIIENLTEKLKNI